MPKRFSGINRRTALALGAGGAFGTLAAGDSARAQTAPIQNESGAMPDPHPLAPGWRRFTFGEAELTCVLDGIRPGEGPFPTFGENQTAELVGDLMAANALPRDRFANFFNVALVEIGDQLVVVDTGFGEGGRANGMGLLVQRMAAAGFAPEDVDVVALTHLHGDHIGGLTEGSTPTFPNARYVVGREELAFWTSEEAKTGPRAENAQAVATKVVPFEGRMTLLADGDEVVPGMVARAAFGHTPGMLAFEVDGGDGAKVLLAADTFSQFVVSFQRPEWHVRFDQDKEAAAATRQRLAERLADEGMAVMGYHLPFPGVGYVQRDGDAFRFVPETYQTLVDA